MDGRQCQFSRLLVQKEIQRVEPQLLACYFRHHRSIQKASTPSTAAAIR